MLTVLANQGPVLECHNSQKDCVAAVSKSKNIAIAGIVVAIVGLLVALLGVLLFILCSAALLPVTISLVTVGIILLLCGVVLSSVFYYRWKTSLNSRRLLDAPVRVETVLNYLRTNIGDLKSKVELLCKELPEFKERLEELSAAFVNGIESSHSELSNKFYSDFADETFLTKDIETSLKSELDFLEQRFNRCFEAVNLNFELHKHIKHVENLCQKIGFSSRDTKIILNDLMELQEDSLGLSATIFKEESLTLSEVEDYKSKIEDFFNKGRNAYDFVVTQTVVLEEFQREENGDTLKDVFNNKIRQIGCIMSLYSCDRLMTLQQGIQDQFTAAFEDFHDFQKQLFDRIDIGLWVLAEKIQPYSSKDISIVGKREDIERWSRLTDMMAQSWLKLAKKGDQEQKDLQKRVAGQVYSSVLEIVSRSRTCRKDESFSDFFYEAAVNSCLVIATEVKNYSSLLMNLKSLIFDLGQFLLSVDSDRSGLLQKLHSLSDALAEISGISLTEEEKFPQNEETLLKKIGVLVEKCSRQQENYLCNRRLSHILIDLADRTENKSEDEIGMILDAFDKEITEKQTSLPTDEICRESLVKYREYVEEWKAIAVNFESINVFSKIAALFEERSELKESYKMKNLTKQDKSGIKKKLKDNKSSIDLMKKSLQTKLEKGCFERLQNKKTRSECLECLKLIR